MSLFDSNPLSHTDFAVGDSKRPLADRMRPRTLDEYAGQEHILGPGKPPSGIAYFAAILRDIQPRLFVLKRINP